MSKRKDFLVIGLGRFGSAIVNTLLKGNHSVTVVDISEERVSRMASRTEYAKVCDTRNEEVLQQLGVNNFDHIVVAIGSSIEASIITTLLLNDMGVTNLTVKASNHQHKSALLKIGIPSNNIILPEQEMGEKVAMTLAIPIIADYVSLIGDCHGIIEMFPGKTQFTGKHLKDLHLKEKYNVTLAAIKRDDEIILPQGDTIIDESDSLIVIGENEALIKFEEIF